MRAQAYGTWKTMFYESLVRACQVRYARRYGGVSAARRATRYQEARGFAWTGKLADLLGEYEANRNKYPTLEAFAPRLVAFFDEYCKRKKLTKQEAREKRIWWAMYYTWLRGEYWYEDNQAK